VEHPFRVIKRQFGFVKVRYRGKNTAQKCRNGAAKTA
jgi:IS5 family transposase